MANYHLCARDIMQTEVATILPELTIQDAAALMRHHGVSSLVVEKDSADDAYGLITYADIVTKVLAYGFDPAEIRVDEIMTKPLIVVNAYTQFDWRGSGPKVDYDAVRSSMRWIKKHHTGKRIGLPKIGAGLAGGEWPTIAAILEEELGGENVTLVEFKS